VWPTPGCVRPANHRSEPHPLKKCQRRVAINATQSSDPDPDLAGGATSQLMTPWQLMGRVVKEERVGFSEVAQQGLLRSAAARASGVSVEEFEEKLEVSSLPLRSCLLGGCGGRQSLTRRPANCSDVKCLNQSINQVAALIKSPHEECNHGQLSRLACG